MQKVLPKTRLTSHEEAWLPLFCHWTLPHSQTLSAAEALLQSIDLAVLTFPKPRRPRRRAPAGSRQLAVVAFEDNESHEVERGVLRGPQGR